MLRLPDKRIIGLTGMSGAGKSTVRDALGGLLVINCDETAYEASRKASFLDEIRERFPDNILKDDGTLDRAETAAIIYGDKAKRALYEGILFPYIIYEIIARIKADSRDVLLDAPTLFESGVDMICTVKIAVTADRRLCEERIIKRDGISRESARARLLAQHTEDFFRESCDFVIENNGTPEELAEKTKQLLETLKVNV